jgi:D-alanyl-D-alanine carboxypeptidase/D-alanyl-D-alanine-endopeptidase (penicillin-binding protein 4)
MALAIPIATNEIGMRLPPNRGKTARGFVLDRVRGCAIIGHLMKAQMKRLLIGVVFALCLGSFAKADLANQVDRIISQSLQRRVKFSIHIVEADSGSTLYDHNARDLMIPASNMKIMVSTAALKYLGPDYEFNTKVGLCDDTLVIIGSGDPLLGDEKTDAKYGREPGWIFKDITHTLKGKGIETVEDIIVDNSVYDDEYVHPSWSANDLNKWYACEVSGLNYNDNCVGIGAKNIGGRTSVFIQPQTSFVTLINEVVPISKGNSSIGTYRNRQPNKLTVRGKCKEEEYGPFDVAIEQPAAISACLSSTARRSPIVWRGVTRTAWDWRPKRCSRPSPPIIVRAEKAEVGRRDGS